MRLANPAAAQDEEAQVMLTAGPVAIPMQQGDVWKASKTWMTAFENDPCMLYMKADGKSSSPYFKRALYIFVLTLSIRNMIMFTVNGGTSFTITEPPPNVPKSPVNRLKDKLIDLVVPMFNQKLTIEQQKRRSEWVDKTTKVISEVLGDRVNRMLQIGLAATEPQSQGHGFGGAVLGAVTSLADSLGCACWLQSSNTANDVFYNSHSFYTVGKIYLGDNNPEWKGEPILYQIMIRESTTKLETRKLETLPSSKFVRAQLVNSRHAFIVPF